MPKSKLSSLQIVYSCTLVTLLAIGFCSFSHVVQAEETAASGNLRQAAEAIVVVANERVATAKTENEAIQNARMSDQALTLIGQLGKFDTTPQADKLLSFYLQSNRPVVADAVIKLRLVNDLRNWEELSPQQRVASISHFAADIKKTGLTRGQADLLMRIANMLGEREEGSAIAKAIDSVLPLARESREPEINRMVPIFDGIKRRLALPGNPIEIEGTLLGGQKINWGSYKGKVVLIDFFASFCEPCRAEVPNVLANYQAYHDKGFEIVGVNLDTNPRLCKAYMDQTGFQFPTIIGERPGANGWDLPLARKYGITAIPRVILVDQNGNVVSTMARGERLGELLTQLLGPSDRPPTRATSSNEDPSVIPTSGISLGESTVIPASTQEKAAPLEPVTLAPEPPEE